MRFFLVLLLVHHARPISDTEIDQASGDELEALQNYLQTQLNKVQSAITSRSKRGISPRSASLPNRESAGFLNRIGALQKNAAMQEDVKANTTTKNTPTPKKGLPDVSAQFDSGNFQHINDSLQECKKLSQPELVAELKQKGTYNPELMAWDALGVIRFLDRTIHESYQRQENKTKQNSDDVVEKNFEALSHLMKELNVSCDLRSQTIRTKLQNLSLVEPRRSIISPSLRRQKRKDELEEFLALLKLDKPLYTSRQSDQPLTVENEKISTHQKMIGESHVVPFGCDKRGAEEDGYLRLCGACQAIRRLPDTFFPPFINEVTCDTDKACLYFYDYPHGKCRQKHMNFVVLRNVGSQECQIWKKFNLNVRVSCECFVDEMSFFAKYV